MLVTSSGPLSVRGLRSYSSENVIAGTGTLFALGLGHRLPVLANGLELEQIAIGQLAQIVAGHPVAQQGKRLGRCFPWSQLKQKRC